MTRLQWVLLALSVAAAAVLVGSWDRSADKEAITREDANEGEPDLYMEKAVISQFDVVGNLRYQLKASKISHFADRRVTQLQAPALELLRNDGPPWVATAADGQVDYAAPAAAASAEEKNPAALHTDRDTTNSMTILGGSATASYETVHLTNGVTLSRNDGVHYVRLTTNRLTVMPVTRDAQTDAPVLIVTDTGRTIASGMSGELETGRLQLFSDSRQRVTTIVNSLTH